MQSTRINRYRLLIRVELIVLPYVLNRNTTRKCQTRLAFSCLSFDLPGQQVGILTGKMTRNEQKQEQVTANFSYLCDYRESAVLPLYHRS